MQSQDEEKPENIREELLHMAQRGEIKHTESYIRKAGIPALEKIYSLAKKKAQDKVTEMLTKSLVEKFSGLLEQLSLVDSGEDLDRELAGNELLLRDLKTFVGFVAPFIPFVGIVTGGLTTAKHVYRNRGTKPETEPKTKENPTKPETEPKTKENPTEPEKTE